MFFKEKGLVVIGNQEFKNTVAAHDRKVRDGKAGFRSRKELIVDKINRFSHDCDYIASERVMC